ncbi:MAG TPA: hypothetical protein VG102_00350 [Candidatus Paceibacterota bacterium]|jgi:hypothetical protein|nr:hypothetical protein [Candidatus Paceibacterota bacterium]
MPAIWGAAFVTVHLLFWFIISVIESWESRTGRIPARRGWDDVSPFPYFQDWHTVTWGDLAGLSLIDFSAGYILCATIPSWGAVLLSLVVAALGALSFHFRCMSRLHKPDSGYPAPGVISAHGFAHVVYFFIQLSICMLAAFLALEGKLTGTVLFAALLGGAVYVASFLFDWYPGRYSLKP